MPKLLFNKFRCHLLPVFNNSEELSFLILPTFNLMSSMFPNPSITILS